MINAHKLLVSLIERKDASGNSKFIYFADTIAEEVAIIEEAIKYSQEWVGLTDDEIKEIIGPWGDTPIKGYTRKLFDQIENKLREKNEIRNP